MPTTRRHLRRIPGSISLKLHAHLCNMVNYKIAPSDQAFPKVIVCLCSTLNSSTPSATDLEVKKFVLWSQTTDTKDKETKLGEDGELTIQSKEEDNVNCGSLSDVLVAIKTRSSTLLAAGFRAVQSVPGMLGMYTRGDHGAPSVTPTGG